MLQILYTVLLIIGLVLCFFAFQHFKKTQNLLSEGVQVEATVVRLIEISSTEINKRKNKTVLWVEINDSIKAFRINALQTDVENALSSTKTVKQKAEP